MAKIQDLGFGLTFNDKHYPTFSNFALINLGNIRGR